MSKMNFNGKKETAGKNECQACVTCVLDTSAIKGSFMPEILCPPQHFYSYWRLKPA